MKQITVVRVNNFATFSKYIYYLCMEFDEVTMF